MNIQYHISVLHNSDSVIAIQYSTVRYSIGQFVSAAFAAEKDSHSLLHLEDLSRLVAAMSRTSTMYGPASPKTPMKMRVDKELSMTPEKTTRRSNRSELFAASPTKSMKVMPGISSSPPKVTPGSPAKTRSKLSGSAKSSRKTCASKHGSKPMKTKKAMKAKGAAAMQAMDLRKSAWRKIRCRINMEWRDLVDYNASFGTGPGISFKKLLYCILVQYSTVQYSTVQYNTVQYSTATVSWYSKQYNTILYSTVQYSTVHSQYITRQHCGIQWLQYATVQ